jgi:SAM-dependent methyltransferase
MTSGEQFEPFSEAMLAEVAPVALAWSRELCRHVNPSGHSCAAYHGIWQYLRLLGINTALFADAAFYRDAMRPAIRRGARRVLVSGCADYAMVAVVLWIFSGEGVRPEITALDVCETPLRLSQWYARRNGADVAIAVGDILDYRPATRFDIICTNSFLGFFSAGQRPALAARWYDLLAPGGTLAIVNRLRADAPEIERFSAAQARDFADRVRREATARQDRLGSAIRPDELAVLADAYIVQNVVQALRSEADLTAMMTGAGFAIDMLQSRTVNDPSRLRGPTMTGGATYLQVAASRRN